MPSIKRMIWWFSPLAVLGVLFYHFYGSESQTPHYHWEKQVERAYERAQKEQRGIFLLASAKKCETCRTLKSTTLADKRLARYLSDRFVLLFLEAPEDRAAFEKTGLNISQAPTIFVLDAKGRERDRIEGFIAPDALLDRLMAID